MSSTSRTPPSLWKGIFDELRLQAHLAAMKLKDEARPWLHEVDLAARDLVRERRERKLGKVRK